MAHLSKEERFQKYNEEHSKIVVPNMLYKDVAPSFVSIIGPEKSLKSKILNKLIFSFTKQEISPMGPVTLKTKTRRFSLFECPNNLESIIDTIKITDIAILTINLLVGLEKDTLEILNIINSHGLIKMIFVFTNSSKVKEGKKALKNKKEEIFKRISQEYSFTLKAFDFDEDGIERIARHLDGMKCRPVEWKCTHPHIVVDQKKGSYLYGYLRGGPLGRNVDVYVPGYGDYYISNIEAIDDPCSPNHKSIKVFNPMAASEVVEEESRSSINKSFFEDEKIQLFEDGIVNEESLSEVQDKSNDNQEYEALENEANQSENNISNDIKQEQETDINQDKEVNISDLKARLKNRFRKEANTEEELIEKFNREYKEDGKTQELNFLQIQKLKEQNIKKDIEEQTQLFLPGTYVRVPLDLSYKPDSLLILGSCTTSERDECTLQGKVVKNRWQSRDLKSNVPYFFSIGWYRFQGVPIFGEENRVLKYLKSSIAVNASDIMFYGPLVSVGTSFFIYNPSSSYRILASGQVLDTSGQLSIKKSMKLVGYPKKVIGHTCIVKSMFTSQKEADKFTHAKLVCASGLRGIMKSSIGKFGDFRATFEANILMSDIVYIKCNIPMKPVEFISHVKPGAKFIRSLHEIKAENCEISEESSEYLSETESIIEERPVKSAIEKEISLMEKKLPFEVRQKRIIKESINLPAPPEQIDYIEEKVNIESARELKDEEENQAMLAKAELKKKKKEEKLKLKQERKRKNAVENKLNLKRNKLRK